MPPVGCIARLHGIKETTHLDFKHSDHCQVNLWRNGDEVEVISVKGKELAVVWHEESKTACGILVKFLLPLKTEAEKKRDEDVNLIMSWVHHAGRAEVEMIYDAFISGKIPGVKLDN